MAHSKRMLLACAALLLAGPASAQDEARVAYQLVEPSGFKDFEIRREGVDFTAGVFDQRFQQYFVPRAERLLPQGQRLVLRILDIDMAGDIQPWRNNRFEPIRYVEFGHPPRMEIEYKLLDPAGGVLAEGREWITDPSFDIRRRTAHQDDTFVIELDMLERWLERLLAERKG